ncbi:LOW QUALITY PROTEIN: ent-kaurenoic acid oxidase 2-like [Abrus precatorius]|uniref:LOW QUALITY PROTEIN: ent-kaurenoic acid oxidase 2-like n=1 Tax=Abrus precatorius TaxID=3816 RepID=A0A8B8MJW7_ABRPR|nr:LOW QUALITY PROTEIN: ent-kaurenoic acid oxidase 2-like [Abrus precatorius]
MGSMWVLYVAGAVLALKFLFKNVNWMLYEYKLGGKQYFLPPGDMGWPLIGNMWSFLNAFKTNDPDSFMDSFVSRFGKTGIYKVLMFGKPSVIVTTPEACKKVLTDDDKFTLGWPRSTVDLIGKKSFISMPYDEHRRLRRLTSASINGYEALSIYLKYIEEIVISSLEKWTTMGDIEFLTQMRKLTFKIIMHIFLGAESQSIMEALEKEYTTLNHGVRAMRINLPGFAFHKALKARKKLLAVFQSVVDKRRNERKERSPNKKAKDMIDALIDAEDENGRKLGDEDIIDIMLMYLNAGHESSGHITMWATYFLQRHPKFFKKAKEEQEEIVRKRPSTQKGLTLEEVRKMEYLSKVIDETLRVVTFSLMVFREAKSDVNINGYMIPKGWKVLVWFRSVHLDPEIYPNPKEFNPDRWNEVRKAGEFLPFGAGTRLCPGNDLAKLEISVFLHHFLLNYELEQLNPNSPLRFLPHTRPMDNCLARIKKIK